jgi:hypothetical protein
MLGLIDGVEEVLLSVDSAYVNCDHSNEHEVPVDMLQSLQLHNLSPAQLKIKLGC